MFWLFLESGRPVLEQLELCVNSHVCSVEAKLHLGNDQEQFARVYSLYAGTGVEGIADRVSKRCLARRLIVRISFTVTDLPRCRVWTR